MEKGASSIGGGVKRLFSVDLLRGLDIFFLTAVNYSGFFAAWKKAWPFHETGERLWTHALTAFETPGHPSTGFGIVDFTQPLFIFITGVSAALAMSRFITPERTDYAGFFKRLLKRVAMLWAIGSLIRGVQSFQLFTGSQPSFVFYSDTLHTIAVAYGAASLGLLLGNRIARLALGTALVAGMAVVMACCGDYSRTGNAARIFEDMVYGALGGKGKDFCYLLTTFTWCGMGILASLVGDVLKSGLANWSKAKVLAAAGTISLALGWTLWLWIPPIRFIYTASFVFMTLGASTLILDGLYVLTDILGFRKGTWLFVLYGQCSLAAWVLINLFNGMLPTAAKRFTTGVHVFFGTELYTPFFTWAVQAVMLTWMLWQWRRLRSLK